VTKVGTSKACGTISQQAAVHPWLAADAHRNKQQKTPFSKFFKINYCGPSSFLYNEYRVYHGGKAVGVWRRPPTPSSAEVKERVEI
jgi:hypothetical protein